MKDHHKLLTIGQFAAMHGINKKTLMWYDEIGLLKPAFIHPENGYRFYTYYQSPILETILLLRELDVSIKEIQQFMKNRCASSLKILLEEKIKDLDSQIAHLLAVKTTLQSHQKNMTTLLTMDLSEITIIEKRSAALSQWTLAKTLPLKKPWNELRPKQKNIIWAASTTLPTVP